MKSERTPVSYQSLLELAERGSTVRGRWLAGPTALAIIVSVANAIKPVVVDDTAYLAYARHIAQHPLDPYGFKIFWYEAPEPAMNVLAPPVVPYWLALGIRLFGDEPALLKLWLFPFVWVFAWSLAKLLLRFARGSEQIALPLILLSPAVLPMVNLMLDIPAAALGLFSLVLLIEAGDRRRRKLACFAGIAAALAIQTKYTALLIPPLLLWYGYTHRTLRLAIIAVSVSGILFGVWEAFLWAKYGDSHFVVHLLRQRPSGGFLREKSTLLPALVGHLGCLAAATGLYAGRAIGLANRVLVAAAIAFSIGITVVILMPFRDTILIPGREPGQVKLSLPSLVWRTAGTATLLTAVASASLLLLRRRPRISLRLCAGTIFVLGWVLLELTGYFALTPFPAARRVIGPTISLAILAARTVSRISRIEPNRTPPKWVLPFGIALGVVVTAIEVFDAFPEKTLAKQAALVTPPGRTWFIGHWGFQYYCEREGLRPLVPGQTILHEGDGLVLPLYPDDVLLYRPHSGLDPIHPPSDAVELLAVFVWDDWLSAQTIPNFYGGVEPIVGRGHPRLRVAVFRITRTWQVH